MTVILRCRRSIRCIVNNVSHVTRISHDSHFAWQVQYSLTLEDDTGCAAHCK